MKSRLQNRILELSSEQIANRKNIKFIVHEIENENLNGCLYRETYVQNNIDSAKNMMLFASFLDEENDNIDKKEYYGHGEEKDGDGYIFPNVNIVGCATNAYVCNLEVKGEIGNYLVAEGYLQYDKFTAFCDQLEEEINSGNPPKTSVEIIAKPGNDGIVYESGKWTPTNRVPVEYQYNGSCFVVNPSDKKAILLELNSVKEGENLGAKKKIEDKTFELNAINYYDICSIITRAFNKAMNPECSCWCDDYWIHNLYPNEAYAVFRQWDKPGEYWKVSYSITNNSIQIGDITEVTEDWKPKSDSNPVDIDLSSLKKDFENKEEEMNICKKDKELNNNQGGSGDMADGVKSNPNDSTMIEINEKLTTLTEKLADSDNKIAELNNAIVEANKTIEAQKAELNSANEELKALREFKADKDSEAKKAEINSYFEKEISKNGFNDIELNSLKEYVEKVDLDGLKKAESDLCVKKIKELNTIQKSTELNSDKSNDLFMAIRNNENADEDFSDIL